MAESEFMPLLELSQRSGLTPRTIYNMHHRGGVLSPILVKFGTRLGCWRKDWALFTAQQMKLAGDNLQRRLPAEGGNLDAPHAQDASIETPKNQRGTTNHGKRNSA